MFKHENHAVRHAAVETLEKRSLFSISLSPIGSFDHGGEGSAEIVAFDDKTKRMFVVNAATDSVDVMGVAPDGTVSKLTTIDTSAIGSPNSVSAKNGLVAVAVQAPVKTDLGFVLFYTTNGTLLKTAQVGALPDMLTFTPDGKKVVVANEGEPNDDYTVDPEGSISVIDLSKGLNGLRISTADFPRFDNKKDSLIAAGVRIYGPGASVSQDLEPEYITVSDDSKTAYVTLQEANAIAIVNLSSNRVEKIVPLGYKDWSTDGNTSKLYSRDWDTFPAIGTTLGGQELKLGGFSGLYFEGYTKSGNMRFVTHTDRGPNAEPTGQNRPFLLPDYSPKIVRLELNTKNGQIKVLQTIDLKRADGTPITGLPNTSIPSATANTPYQDEVPVDLLGNVLPYDDFGGDFEGIVVDKDGSFWMCDEYRPAIYHFDKHGRLIDRFVPQGTGAAAGRPAGTFGAEVLPAVLGQRRQNRGFEALAMQDGKLYAFVQSPLRNPTTATNGQLNANRNVRVVEFDPSTLATKQYVYIMDNLPANNANDSRADKIGDAASIGHGQFLVVERDDDAVDSDNLEDIQKKVYKFSLDGATDISGIDTIDVGGGVFKTVDQMTAAELEAAGIGAIEKTLHVDLNKAGYNTVEKVEGLALVDSETIAVINDNDFTVASITVDPVTGKFTRSGEPEDVVLGVITVKNRTLDTSDKDGGINFRNAPVFGMYQPDTIDSYTVGGRTYLVTANEGDSRDYDGFSEEARVKDLDLDPTAFPNAAELQADDNIGRLKITTALGDTDDDGDYDRLYTYGARSFSIWDNRGKLVFDSESLLEHLTAERVPELFNSEGTADGFDTRSDDKGPEPEAVTVGEIKGRAYAFIGLERTSGIVVMDVTNPKRPTFVQYIQPEFDIAPEGLAFVPASKSPTGKPLLAVANEVSGTTSLYGIALEPDMSNNCYGPKPSGKDDIFKGFKSIAHGLFA